MDSIYRNIYKEKSCNRLVVWEKKIEKFMKEITFKKKVKAIEVHNPKKISQLLSEMTRTGFQGRKLQNNFCFS